MGKGEQTRADILSLALGQASQLGLEGLSIGNLARELGMSKSGLFAHFGSKAGLQQQVLALAAQRFGREIVLPALSLARGEPRVVALFENWLSWNASKDLPGGCLFVSTAMELDARPGPVRDLLEARLGQWLQTLERAAGIAVEEGHFRADLDPRLFAFQLHSLTLGFHVQAGLFETPDALSLARRAFAELLTASRVA